MYGRYTALSAPCPVKKWPPSMDIRIVLTGPNNFRWYNLDTDIRDLKTGEEGAQ
jgi:hypothetical protein